LGGGGLLPSPPTDRSLAHPESREAALEAAHAYVRQQQNAEKMPLKYNIQSTPYQQLGGSPQFVTSSPSGQMARAFQAQVRVNRTMDMGQRAD